MNKILLSVAVISVLVSGCSSKNEMFKKTVDTHSAKHWSYSGDTSPIHWGDLKKDYFMCKEGKNQSPINITDARATEKNDIKFTYFTGGDKVVNNGHTIEVVYKPGSFIDIDGHKFELKQFHFHTPSENHIEGKSFPAEIHFVHKDKDGNLAVLALMVEEGAKNLELDKILSSVSDKVNDEKELENPVSASSLMPTDVDYYRFNGSLTTPPCSEGVIWAVFKKHITASKEQLEKLHKLIGFNNNRPIQPIDARLIIK